MSAPLAPVALAHAVLAVVCVVLLVAVDASPLTGVHPALKPFKFALSIAALLAVVAIVLPRIDTSSIARGVIGWILVGTMVIEMTIIVAQALRGTTSHFNYRTPLDATLWHVMGGSIVIASLALIALAWIATTHAIAGSPLVACALRVGLWLVLLVAISGMAMGGRMAHTVGGPDGGPGLPMIDWSTRHGDLRVSHFFALHGLQAFPLAALALERLPIDARVRWGVLIGVMLAWTAVAIATLVMAFAGRPVWRA